MNRSWFQRKKLIVSIILFGVGLIFLTKYVDFEPPQDMGIPPYIITHNSDIDLILKRPKTHDPVNVSTSTRTFIYIESYLDVASNYVSELLKVSGYLAGVLSDEISTAENFTSTSQFNCVCGRVSDPCICCGLLATVIPKSNHLTLDLYRPIILSPNSTNDEPVTYCLNVTYLPNRKQIRTSGSLFYPAQTHPYLDIAIDVTNKTNSPVSFGPNVSKVLFSSLFLNFATKPVICVGSNNALHVVDLCTHFTLLEYKFDSGTDHKTVFHGCAYVDIILDRMYILAKYPQFCFLAHRGAAGDADQAANRMPQKPLIVVEKQLVQNILPNKTILNLPKNMKNPNASSVVVTEDVDSQVMDGHEVHRGVP